MAKHPLTVFALILTSVCLLRLPVLSRSVLDWDESLYMLMANQWLAGHLPYTTIWDNKPPIIYAIFAVFKFLLRAPVLAMRAATITAVSCTAFGLWRLAPLCLADTQPAAPARLAALAAAAFIVGSLSNDGLSANTETFMECFSVFAILAAIAPSFCPRAPWRRGLVAGLLFGLACMTKYVAVFEAPALACALLLIRAEPWSWRDTWAKCAGALAGALLTPALTVTLYALTGHLALWWQCAILANITRVNVPISPSQLQYAALVILPRWLPFDLAGLCLFARALTRRPTKLHVLLMLWLTGGALGVAAAKSFYDHYFLQILPPLCLALVWVLARPRLRLAAWPRWRFLALCAALLAIPAAAGESALAAIRATPDTPSRIAAALRPAITAGATLYIFDSQPIIYALTNAAPPTRYVFPSVLTKCPLEKVAGIDAAQELAAILSTNPYFILRTPSPPPPGANRSVYAELTKTLAARYTLSQSYPDALLYHRKPGAPAGALQPIPDSCMQK